MYGAVLANLTILIRSIPSDTLRNPSMALSIFNSITDYKCSTENEYAAGYRSELLLKIRRKKIYTFCSDYPTSKDMTSMLRPKYI